MYQKAYNKVIIKDLQFIHVLFSIREVYIKRIIDTVIEAQDIAFRSDHLNGTGEMLKSPIAANV